MNLEESLRTAREEGTSRRNKLKKTIGVIVGTMVTLVVLTLMTVWVTQTADTSKEKAPELRPLGSVMVTLYAPPDGWSKGGRVLTDPEKKSVPWTCMPPKEVHVLTSRGHKLKDGPNEKNNLGAKIKQGDVIWYRSASSETVPIPCWGLGETEERPRVHST